MGFFTDRSRQQAQKANLDRILLQLNAAAEEFTTYNGGDLEVGRRLSERFWAQKELYDLTSQYLLLEQAREFALEIPDDKFLPGIDPLATSGTLLRDRGTTLGRRVILTPDGEAWVRRHLKKARVDEAKDLVAIVMPILTLLSSSAIAILGLIVALNKR